MSDRFMIEAIKQAKKAWDIDEVPIGCVIVKNGKVIARAYNRRESTQQSIAHAEILAIQKACKKLNSWRLDGCDLYVTLEPCPMCAGAILQSRIRKVCYGASDPKGGSIESCMRMYETSGFNHYPEVESGLMQEECSNMLRHFFRIKRLQKKNSRMMDRCPDDQQT